MKKSQYINELDKIIEEGDTLGLDAYLKTLKTDAYGLFLETAHPIKFHDVVKDALGLSLEIPKALKPLMNREKKAHPIKNYDDLKRFLTSPTP